MKKIIITGSLFLLALSAKAQTTIYTGNGSLNANRTVTLNGKSLHFSPLIGTGVFINSSGSVGIGTSSLPEKLTVSGNVLANSGYFNTKYTSSTSTYSFTDSAVRNANCLVIGGGYLLNSSSKTRVFSFFDFPKSNLNAQATVMLDIEDRSYMSRLRFTALQGAQSYFTLYDKNQLTNFTVQDENDDVYVIMPKESTHVCIGTSNAVDGSDTYKLSVAGKVRAYEVKVYNTWADYVFEEDYNLKPLTEVEEFIAENGHLPNVPSAAEVEEKGIELGEMTKIQQEKIEELTLYLIQQDKENQQLKEELKELKAIVNTLVEQKNK